MITRLVYSQEKKQFNQLIRHPVQTWEWGDFQITQGHQVYRLGVFEKNKMISAYSLSFHRLPRLNFSVGTILRGPMPDLEMLTNIQKIGRDENALFIKLEPDVIHQSFSDLGIGSVISPSPDLPNLVVSPKVAFYPHTYFVDLTKTENELIEALHSKTRYNIKVANRHGVKIREMTTDQGFEIYLRLLFETTKRQGFYLHTPEYHQQLWQTLKASGMVKIMIATYQDLALAAFMLFKQQDRLYYPYGASSDVHREVMAPTLLMWECLMLGKKLGCNTFDMWGSLGPNAQATEPGFGFHRFKQGFGGQLSQYVGTYDLVIDPQKYQLYNLVDRWRWRLLRFKANLFKTTTD
ncbi:MAG: peptidoglycan bridge formation glycyltransferase FemA/FemB family protein [Candidatus Shapirobacteria bacterium]|jgi:lipid II:glycine glycyltransferase (peptidoglycan interpeptide bridge formation enzyme)